MKHICKEAKKLDDTGLDLVVNVEDSGTKVVYFVKDSEPEAITVKKLIVSSN